MQCPVCEKTVPEGQTVCEECGTEIGTQAEKPASAESGTASEVFPVPATHPTPVVSPSEGPSVPAHLLLKRAGTLTGDEFPVGEEVVIGRFDEDMGPVDIDLVGIPESPYISRRHAKIYREASGQWFVEDLGSSNGTFLWKSGGQPQRLSAHQPTAINDGDEVAFGNARFVFRTQ